MSKTHTFNDEMTREADANVTKIVEEHLAGKRSEQSARTAIAGILFSTNILVKVAATADATPAEREELGEKLLSLMSTKMLQSNGTRHMDLEKLRTGSACGWFRQFARTAHKSELRNLRSARRRFGVPIDLSAPGTSASIAFREMSDTSAVNTPFAANLSTHKTVEELVAEESALDLIEEYTDRARYLRGTRVEFVKAEYLRHYFNLPSAVRLPSPEDRVFVLKQLEKDENAAYRSASIAFRLLTGELNDKDVTTDQRMIAIWDNHDIDSLDSLLERPGQVAHTLATVAVITRPRPSSTSLKKFQRLVTTVNIQPEWAKLAHALTEAYIATEFKATSSYSEHRLTDVERLKIEKNQEKLQHMWGTTVNTVTSFPGAPLGSTPEQVRHALDVRAKEAGAIELVTTLGS